MTKPFEEKQLNTLKLIQAHYQYQSNLHASMEHLMRVIIQLHEDYQDNWTQGNLMMLQAQIVQWQALKIQYQESIEKSVELGIYETLYR